MLSIIKLRYIVYQNSPPQSLATKTPPNQYIHNTAFVLNAQNVRNI